MKHSLKILAAAGLLFSAQRLAGQANVCATGVPSPQWEAHFQQLIQQTKANAAANKTEAIVYTIPVIIHVIHGGEAVGTYPNLASGQLVSQVQVLNDDYAGAGLNSGNYPAGAFSAWATTQSLTAASLDTTGRVGIADCHIQFCLATQDTLGNVLPEPGIERISYVTKGWSNPNSFTTLNSFRAFIDTIVKPQSIWNVSRYLNVWVTDENINAPGIGGLLGYATFPPISTLSGFQNITTGTKTTDGFWCFAKAFGSNNIFPGGSYYSATYNKGRTCSHEIGHWLGLRHIWGDGVCATDYCNDTPPAGASNSGTPTYPYHSGTCSGNSPNGEMFMNFMDYTNDNGKYMFTTDQATRMQTAMINSPYRKYMGTHGLCTVSAIAANPSFSMSSAACTGTIVPLNNTSYGTPVPSYSWTASGGVFSPNASAVSPSISFTSPGTYTVTLAAGNGTTNSITQTITVNPTPVIVFSVASQTVCAQQQVSITASGANAYAWQPGGSTNAVLTFVASADETFTCSATSASGCKSKSSITISVAQCTGFTVINAEALAFSVYPNPVNDRLILRLSTASTLNGTLEIADITGKIILTQPLTFARDNNEMPLDLSAFENGLYLLKISTGHQTQVIKLVKK